MSRGGAITATDVSGVGELHAAIDACTAERSP